jgi:20S proteasome alpha/beta subunit
VAQGLPSLGIRCSNGVVLASEKPHPSILSDQSSFEKISRVTPDAGVVYSGMGPDFRVLVDKARKGAHAVQLLGIEGKKGAVGPRFRKLTPGEVQDYLGNICNNICVF